jgi:hypothetical protein
VQKGVNDSLASVIAAHRRHWSGKKRIEATKAARNLGLVANGALPSGTVVLYFQHG